MKMGLADIGFDDIEWDVQGPKKFLDIGCATGMLLAHMKERGWEEQGVEVCEPSARFGREARRLQILTSTLEDAAFDRDTFHVIHCSHLIEHLEDPGSFFKEVHRVLKPGGYLILTTPNISGLQARLKRGGWRSAIADHLYLFSPATLRLYLREHHLEPLRWKTWGGIPKGEAPESIKKIVDRLVKVLGWGDVMICCARKATAT
jgi:SAM-dependent methyltransferase